MSSKEEIYLGEALAEWAVIKKVDFPHTTKVAAHGMMFDITVSKTDLTPNFKPELRVFTPMRLAALVTLVFASFSVLGYTHDYWVTAKFAMYAMMFFGFGWLEYDDMVDSYE